MNEYYQQYIEYVTHNRIFCLSCLFGFYIVVQTIGLMILNPQKNPIKDLLWFIVGTTMFMFVFIAAVNIKLKVPMNSCFIKLMDDHTGGYFGKAN